MKEILERIYQQNPQIGESSKKEKDDESDEEEDDDEENESDDEEDGDDNDDDDDGGGDGDVGGDAGVSGSGDVGKEKDAREKEKRSKQEHDSSKQTQSQPQSSTQASASGLSEKDQRRLKRFIKRGLVPASFTAKFREIFLCSDDGLYLEYDQPALKTKEGEVHPEMAKDILEGLAAQAGISFEELIKRKQIPDIPSKEQGTHYDDKDDAFDKVEIEDVSHEEYPEYYNICDTLGIPFFDEVFSIINSSIRLF